MVSEIDYYEILEVRDNASNEVIRMAYKALALKYHPDKIRGDSTTTNSRMQKINEAYEVLSDSENRKRYDEYLVTKRNQSSINQREESERTQSEAIRKDEEERLQKEKQKEESQRERAQAKPRDESERHKDDIGRYEEMKRRREFYFSFVIAILIFTMGLFIANNVKDLDSKDTIGLNLGNIEDSISKISSDDSIPDYPNILTEDSISKADNTLNETTQLDVSKDLIIGNKQPPKETTQLDVSKDLTIDNKPPSNEATQIDSSNEKQLIEPSDFKLVMEVSNVSLHVGTTWNARVSYQQNGKNYDYGEEISWSSNNTDVAIATVYSYNQLIGNVEVVGTGIVTITAETENGLTATATVSCFEAP